MNEWDKASSFEDDLETPEDKMFWIFTDEARITLQNAKFVAGEEGLKEVNAECLYKAIVGKKPIFYQDEDCILTHLNLKINEINFRELDNSLEAQAYKDHLSSLMFSEDLKNSLKASLKFANKCKRAIRHIDIDELLYGLCYTKDFGISLRDMHTFLAEKWMKILKLQEMSEEERLDLIESMFDEIAEEEDDEKSE